MLSCGSSDRRRLTGGKIGGQNDIPGCAVAWAVARPEVADELGTAVSYLNARTPMLLGDEMHVDACRLGCSAPKVPVIGEMFRWRPDHHLAPALLDAGRCSFED